MGRHSSRCCFASLLIFGGGCGLSTEYVPEDEEDTTLDVAAGAPVAEPEILERVTAREQVVEAAASQDWAQPCPNYARDKNVFWGDLHTHTAFSVDAYAFGTRNTPLDAYQFARGAPKRIAVGVRGPDAQQAQLPPGRTLDFNAVTDHSEWLATTYGCGVDGDGRPLNPSSPYYNSAACDLVRANRMGVQPKLCPNGVAGTPECTAVTRSAWEAVQQAAAAANDRCRFTSFVGYEYSLGEPGVMLHRNVIFSGATVPPMPYDSAVYDTPNELFDALDGGCRPENGCTALVIPHNTNFSNGLAFNLPDFSPRTLIQFEKYERLIEIYQHKGSSECWWNFTNGVGNINDPFCNFEHLRRPNDSSRSYVRVGLTLGQMIREQVGINPFRFGIVAATDTHNGTSGFVEEDNYLGAGGKNDDSAERRLNHITSWSPGGITGVWAEQNTRPSLFAAMFRRETFGSSGPRIPIRFYQTWRPDDFCTAAFPRNVIEAGGVPMGGIMSAAPTPTARPWFVVSATKDRTDLAEVHIVKVAIKDGEWKVLRVERIPAPSPGATCVRWQDTQFDPTQHTYYYARVLEQPTRRWSHYDCRAAPGANPACAQGGDLDVMIQERVWTSPIWSSR